MKRLLLVAVLVLAGCVPAPPGEDVSAGEAISIHSTSEERRIREFTVKVRNRGCPDSGVGLGSGFVIGDGRIVTNRHVVAGADQLVVTTWDGRDEVVEVVAAATVSDLAVVEVAGSLPHAVELGEDPDVGEPVVAAGYPEGGAFRLSPGEVTGYASVTDGSEGGDVIVVDATIRQGNSGGPLVDEEGRLVGVVYAMRVSDSAGLAIPVSRLERVLSLDDLDPVEPCSTGYVPADRLAAEEGIGAGDLPPPPSSTTTTTVPCPRGAPTAEVTAVRSTPRPTIWEGEEPSYATTVEGSVTNRASAAAVVIYVEVELTHPDGTTGTGLFLVDRTVPPGGSVAFSGEHFGAGTGAPQAGDVRVEWYWDDAGIALSCT